jgi:hypothetical protein
MIDHLLAVIDLLHVAHTRDVQDRTGTVPAGPYSTYGVQVPHPARHQRQILRNRYCTVTTPYLSIRSSK